MAGAVIISGKCCYYSHVLVEQIEAAPAAKRNTERIPGKGIES